MVVFMRVRGEPKMPSRNWNCPNCGKWRPLDDWYFISDDTRDLDKPSWIECDECKELTALHFIDGEFRPQGAELTE
jgi:hypothetical protein